MYITKEMRDIRHYKKDFHNFAMAVDYSMQDTAFYKGIRKTFEIVIGFILIPFTFVIFAMFLLVGSVVSKKVDKDIFDKMFFEYVAIASVFHIAVWGIGYIFKFSVKEIGLLYLLILGSIITILLITMMLKKIYEGRTEKYIERHIRGVQSKVVKEFILSNKINYMQRNAVWIDQKYFEDFVKWNAKRQSLKYVENQFVRLDFDFELNNELISRREFTAIKKSGLLYTIDHSSILLIIKKENFDFTDNLKEEIFRILNELKNDKYIDYPHFHDSISNNFLKRFDEKLLETLALKERESMLKEEMKKIKKEKEAPTKKRKV